MDSKKIKEIKKIAVEIRRNTIDQIATLGVGHLGGSLSICDLLACLYGHIMKVDPENPKWKERDRFILSKGHAGPAVYSALALKGFFPMEALKTLNKPGTILPSHTDMNKTPGVDMSTGSLGQGISAGVGIAHACKIDKRQNYVYIVLGDGECDEGQVWEAAMYAGHYKLSNIIGFIDKNGLQIDGKTEEVMNIENYAQIFTEFGWHTIEVEDGHNVEQIINAVEKAKAVNDKPSMILLNTVKGWDCPPALRRTLNHIMALTPEETEEAYKFLDNKLVELDSV